MHGLSGAAADGWIVVIVAALASIALLAWDICLPPEGNDR